MHPAPICLFLFCKAFFGPHFLMFQGPHHHHSWGDYLVVQSQAPTKQHSYHESSLSVTLPLTLRVTLRVTSKCQGWKVPAALTITLFIFGLPYSSRVGLSSAEVSSTWFCWMRELGYLCLFTCPDTESSASTWAFSPSRPGNRNFLFISPLL